MTNLIKRNFKVKQRSSTKINDEKLLMRLFNQGKKDTRDLSEAELDQLFKVII